MLKQAQHFDVSQLPKIAQLPEAFQHYRQELGEQVLNIPPELLILCGLAVSYTDPDFPPNHLRISRDPVEKNVLFLDDLKLAHRSDWNTTTGA